MKVVLIEPATADASVYSKLQMPLMGPVYLGTILKDRGHEVEVHVEDIHRSDYSRLRADLIGISILTSNAKRGYEIAGKFPKDKVIIGGVHASLLPGEALQFARQVVVGEAEEVIAAVAEGENRDAIVQGHPIQDLDSLPYPDFSLIKGYKRRPLVMPVSTSRGCPFDCTFCSVTKMFGREYRFRSAENVVEEISKSEAHSLFFCDDNFTAHPKRTRTLLELMLRRKRFPWSCQVRCDVTEDDTLLGLMAKSGCRHVCVGFESVNAKTLQAYKKKQSLGDIISAIRAFHKKKIKIHGMFVLGGDDDSEHTAWDTFKFAKKQKIDTIQMTALTPFPGTKVYEELSRQQRIFSRDWDLYDGQHVVFNPKLVSARNLQLSLVRAYAKFYSFSSSLVLLLKFSFRNALFRFMGYRIVREWKQAHGKMHWLAQANRF